MRNHEELIYLSEKLLPEFNGKKLINSKKESFIDVVSPYVRDLLDRDFQKLVQIMYRIDVSEKEFALTLQPGHDQDVAKSLTELIFKRLQLKAELRARYKSK